MPSSKAADAAYRLRVEAVRLCRSQIAVKVRASEALRPRCKKQLYLRGPIDRSLCCACPCSGIALFWAHVLKFPTLHGGRKHQSMTYIKHSTVITPPQNYPCIIRRDCITAISPSLLRHSMMMLPFRRNCCRQKPGIDCACRLFHLHLYPRPNRLHQTTLIDFLSVQLCRACSVAIEKGNRLKYWWVNSHRSERLNSLHCSEGNAVLWCLISAYYRSELVVWLIYSTPFLTDRKSFAIFSVLYIGFERLQYFCACFLSDCKTCWAVTLAYESIIYYL